MNYRRLFNLESNRQKRYEVIVSLLRIEDSDSVLDIGCGHGLSFEAFDTTNRIVGVDLNPSDYRAADFTFRLANGSELPFADSEFDVAVSIGCFEYITPMTELDACISEINRVAKRALVVVPSITILLESHFHSFLWQLRSYERRRKLSHSSLGFELPGRHEEINYFSDNAWLNFIGFSTWKTKRHWHMFPIVRNLFIYKC
jgi:cyclopropane fatty-acyl-phospholipid synthase-like methyltransferase